ncbi:WD40-repeat-containing domain protein [Geopyxis carbonaria]|nr:WD40-repeat-containing domain protein [Geopyxis carbonaria]
MAKPFNFLPMARPLLLEEDEGVGTDNGHMEDDEDDEDDGDSITVQSKSPPASSTGANAKKHVIEDGMNGIGGPKKRRRRAKNENDEDESIPDVSSSPIAPGDHRLTNGRSVGTQIEGIVEITADDTLVLATQNKNVLFCAWNPVEPALLATASLEPNAQVWEVSPDATSSNAILVDGPSKSNNGKNHITVISWSPEGSRLASGWYDGQTRIWSTDGVVEQNMHIHPGAVSALKWNKDASLLLAHSADGKMIVWDASNGDLQRVFELQGEVAVSVEWISTTQFLAAGDNGGLHHFDVGKDEVLHSRQVHTKEIDCIEWDELTETVATAGSDGSILTWHKPGKDTNPDGKLEGHTEAITALAWQPNPDFIPAYPKRILASGSHDCKVRLWEVVSQTCIRVLELHRDPLERICFSPDGTRLASRAYSAVIVWKIDSGNPTHIHDRLKSKKKNGTIFPEDIGQHDGMSWNDSGTRLAIAEGEYQCTIVRLDAKNPSES